MSIQIGAGAVAIRVSAEGGVRARSPLSRHTEHPLMDRIEDVADKTQRLAAYVRSVRGSGWHVSAALRPQAICIRLTSASTTTLTELCSNTFDEAAAHLRQQLAAETGG